MSSDALVRTVSFLPLFSTLRSIVFFFGVLDIAPC